MGTNTKPSRLFFSVFQPIRAAAFVMLTLAMCGMAFGQVTTETAGPRIGEVVGNNVYVRCGPSKNYYPVLKLNAGDRVTVVGRKGPWLEILPPVDQGAYSWISAEYVDSVDNRHGVVNGSNVRVRAGSTLAEFERHKSRMQRKLNAGDKVRILGRHADGFLKIEPPPGVTFWIGQDLVAFESRQEGSPIKEPSTTPHSVSSPAANKAKLPQEGKPIVDQSAVEESPPKKSTSQFAFVASDRLRHVLESVEAGIKVELAKEVTERNFSPLAAKLKPVSQQTEDEFARRYAVARLAQIGDMEKLVKTLTKMRQLDREVARKRREFLDARSALHAITLPVPAGLDAKGVLRESALYPPGSYPQRYRLVEPKADGARTIGYVEIAPGSNLVIGDYLGRFVGVRASTKRLQKGAAEPVPIYVASELVLLTDEETEITKADDHG